MSERAIPSTRDQVITRGRINAHVLLSDVGLTMDHLSEDERRILDVGIRCGALAVLQLDLGESMEQMRRDEGVVLVPRPEQATCPTCSHDWERHGTEAGGCIECHCRRVGGEA